MNRTMTVALTIMIFVGLLKAACLGERGGHSFFSWKVLGEDWGAFSTSRKVLVHLLLPGAPNQPPTPEPPMKTSEESFAEVEVFDVINISW